MKTYAYALSAFLIGATFVVGAPADAVPNNAAASTKSNQLLKAVGSVVSADLVGNTLVVKGKKKVQWTFSIPATTKITQNKKTITLGDITTGSKVTVRYTKDRDTLMASSIKVWPSKK